MKAAVLAIAVAIVVVISAFAFLARRPASPPQVPVVCQQYDMFDLSTGNLVPQLGLPLWLRHRAALVDHCPVDPPWGTLPSDHTPIS